MRMLVSLAIGLALAAPLSMRTAIDAAQQAASAPTLVELKDVNDLKAKFNDDRGKTRIVLLVSPT